MISGLHLLFLPYPAFGHMTPALPVMAELVRRGHRVTCFTGEQFLDAARDAGAEAFAYEPALSSDPPADVIDADDCARALLRLLEASRGILPRIEERIAGQPIDAVVYDTTLWLPGRLLGRKRHRPSIQLSPTFCSNETFSMTADSQRFVEPIDPSHPAIVAFDRGFHRTLDEHGLADIDKDEFFHGHHEPTITFLPRAFQFAGHTFGPRTSFVGPTVRPAAPGTWRRPDDDRPVALVTLGTTVNNKPEFFRDCAAALGELPWHIVMTLGGRVDVADLGPLPGNVQAYQWMPHAAVLEHADVFLSQGGMGSVMESLYFGVPMVVVPHHPEQHLNARRIRELGLGAVVDRNRVTPEELRAKVLAVAGDRDIRDRVRVMRRHVREAGGAAKAATTIEERVSAWATPIG